MALSEKSRTRIYTGLEPVLGEEATAEMLAHFPARDSDEPATREFVRAEIADLRGHTDAGLAGVRGEVETLRADMHASLQRMVFALVAVIAAATGIVLSALFSLHG